MRHFLAAIFIVALAGPLLVPDPVLAQERIEVAQKKKTLWDLLFGEEETPQRSTRRSPKTPVARLPPAVPAIEKSPTATRLVVFGDSLAVDLSKALERFHAEDPNIVVLGQGVGSSGFVRDDFFDWNGALADAIALDSFDIAVIIIGINDRQNLSVAGESVAPLSEEWKAAYTARLNRFLQQLRSAQKPVIWMGLPPMEATTYSGAITQISSLHRLAAFGGGAEFVDIYERFTDEAGNFANMGPDLNGQTVSMRKSDGIHFSAAGSDKLAFYINQSLKLFYRGGTISLAVVDPLAGTDAQGLARLPLQGLGQIRLLEVAGAVVPLGRVQQRAGELLLADPGATLPSGFDLDEMVAAPVGRVDAFGVGVEPGE